MVAEEQLAQVECLRQRLQVQAVPNRFRRRSNYDLEELMDKSAVDDLRNQVERVEAGSKWLAVK